MACKLGKKMVSVCLSGMWVCFVRHFSCFLCPKDLCCTLLKYNFKMLGFLSSHLLISQDKHTCIQSYLHSMLSLAHYSQLKSFENHEL